MQWETVIGLEIHAQLSTQSKIFSGSATTFGAEPNTQASLVDLGMPGTLPVLNAEAVRMACKFGLAIDAEIGPDRIAFTTNVGDEVVAGPEHPIRVEDRDGVPRPYVHVRRGLEALIDRKSFYRLVAAAEPDADGRLVLRSQGAVFALEG